MKTSKFRSVTRAVMRGDRPRRVVLDLPQATEWERVASRTKISTMRALGYKLTAVTATVHGQTWDTVKGGIVGTVYCLHHPSDSPCKHCVHLNVRVAGRG